MNTRSSTPARKADETDFTKRFGELSEYDVKREATVYFHINSAELSKAAQNDLCALAANAANAKGYLIQVAGYADATGSTAWNERLSDRRAEAVVDYLRQECTVPVLRVLAPAGMGISQPAASNDTAEGRKANRRVEVKILFNRGMAQENTSAAIR